MAITIHNLTNSPFDLLNDSGEKVRIAARGSIVGFRPHPSQLSIYQSLSYFRIEDHGTSLAERDLTEEDGRSDKRLAKELPRRNHGRLRNRR